MKRRYFKPLAAPKHREALVYPFLFADKSHESLLEQLESLRHRK